MNHLFTTVFASALFFSIVSGQHSPFTEKLSEFPSLLPQDKPEGQEWQLVFNDEFRGPKLDRGKWKLYGDEAPMERRDGYWTSEAVTIDTTLDALVMQTYLRDGKYFDGCLHTEGIFETTYGYFEIRAQLHSQEGHWPAFWLWTGAIDRVGKGGEDGAEIDIFEKFQTNRKVEHTVHWDGYDTWHAAAGKVSKNRGIMTGFHTFSLWWSEEFYRFYVDGHLVWETTAGGICRVPLHLLISDEVGQHKRMRSIGKAELPDRWLVDHVRVWQLSVNTPK